MKEVFTFLSIFILTGASPAAAQEHTMKFGLLGPEGSSWADMAYRFRDHARERTGGKFSIKVYPGGVMGDEPELVQKMRLGQLQAAGLTVLGLSKIAPDTHVLSLPFLFKDYGEVDYVLENTIPLFEKIFEEKGFVFAGWTEVGFAYFFSQTPLRTQEDLGRVKIWTWLGDTIAYDTLTHMGFTHIISLPTLDVLAALQARLINAFYAPLYPCVGFQWFTGAKYMTDFHVFYTPAGVIIERKAFERLPPEFRSFLLKELKVLLRDLTLKIREDEGTAGRALEDAGIGKIRTDPGVIGASVEKSQPLYKKYMGTVYSPWLFNGISQKLIEYRRRGPSFTPGGLGRRPAVDQEQ